MSNSDLPAGASAVDGSLLFQSARDRCQHLVSVRNVREAAAAVAGGADIIDCKEPSRGPLGATTLAEWIAISHAVGPGGVLSVALGELSETATLFEQVGGGVELPSNIRWGKAGLAGEASFSGRGEWRHQLLGLRDVLAGRFGISLVPAAYADSERAGSPPVEEVVDWAIRHAAPAILIDTFSKKQGSVWNHLSAERYRRLRQQTWEAKIPLVLAGSFDASALRRLGELVESLETGPEQRSSHWPDVIAVRGVVCAGGDREREVDSARVRDFIASADTLWRNVVGLPAHT